MSQKNGSRHLSWLGLAAALVSLHFGLGFLIGSGEAIYTQGAKGILYALSTALGLFALAFIANYYWKERLPIWDLLGTNYGKPVRKMVAFLSSTWMFGVLASQILGGAAALTIFGFNKYTSMLMITTLILVISLLDIKKVSKILLATIISIGVVLIYLQFILGWSWAKLSFDSLILSFPNINLSGISNIVIPTVLVTFIGMDFHQFIVRAKSTGDAVWGNIVGGIVLLIISLLTLNIILSSINSGFITNITDPAQVVPEILLNLGKSINPIVGSLLPLIIIFIAVGSGSGIQRIIINTIKLFKLNGKIYKDKYYAALVSIFCFLLALSGKSIINLIVNFYAIYIGSVFLPFIYLLLETKIRAFRIEPKYIRLSFFGSFTSSVFIFVAQFFPIPFIQANTSSMIITAGFSFSLLLVVYSYLIKIRFLKRLAL